MLGKTPDKVAHYTYLYPRGGPWPQPNPQRPLGEAPIVLNIPWQEQLLFGLTVGLGFSLSLTLGVPRAMLAALTSAVDRPIDDGWFSDTLTESSYSKFLTPLVGGDDEKAFAPVLERWPGATFYKQDFTAIRGVKPYDGMYVAPTMVLVKEEPGQEGVQVERRKKRVVAMVVDDDLLLEPEQRDAWDRGKLFVLQGAAYGMLFTEHPNLHFPFDAINAITKSWLPQQHPIYQLLIPHLTFQLPLNVGVLASRLSVITDYRPTYYAPFTANMSDGLLDLFVAGYQGVPGRSGYPEYKFRDRPRQVFSDYGLFLMAYYEKSFLPFARAVAQVALEPEWREMTRQWAVYIAWYIDGFPGGDDIVNEDTLTRVLAHITWDLSLGHAADHKNFSSDVSPEQKFLRLRVKPPAGPQSEPVDMSAAVRWVDRFKMRLAHRTFFEPHVRTRLVDIDYPFTDARLGTAANGFFAELRQTEAWLREQNIRNFMPLEEVPASIQF
jgi:hypothetical protein